MTISISQIHIQRKSSPWILIFIILCVNMYIVDSSFRFSKYTNRFITSKDFSVEMFNFSVLIRKKRIKESY